VVFKKNLIKAKMKNIVFAVFAGLRLPQKACVVICEVFAV